MHNKLAVTKHPHKASQSMTQGSTRQATKVVEIEPRLLLLIVTFSSLPCAVFPLLIVVDPTIRFLPGQYASPAVQSHAGPC